MAVDVDVGSAGLEACPALERVVPGVVDLLAARYDLEPVGAGCQEQLRNAAALVHREQHALAGRPACEQSVDAPGSEGTDEQWERILIQVTPVVSQGRDGGGDRSAQSDSHSTFLRASSVFATGFSAMRRMNHGYQ